MLDVLALAIDLVVQAGRSVPQDVLPDNLVRLLAAAVTSPEDLLAGVARVVQGKDSPEVQLEGSGLQASLQNSLFGPENLRELQDILCADDHMPCCLKLMAAQQLLQALGTSSLAAGHTNPKLISALCEQIATLAHQFASLGSTKAGVPASEEADLGWAALQLLSVLVQSSRWVCSSLLAGADRDVVPCLPLVFHPHAAVRTCMAHLLAPLLFCECAEYASLLQSDADDRVAAQLTLWYHLPKSLKAEQANGGKRNQLDDARHVKVQQILDEQHLLQTVQRPDGSLDLKQLGQRDDGLATRVQALDANCLASAALQIAEADPGYDPMPGNGKSALAPEAVEEMAAAEDALHLIAAYAAAAQEHLSAAELSVALKQLAATQLLQGVLPSIAAVHEKLHIGIRTAAVQAIRCLCAALQILRRSSDDGLSEWQAPLRRPCCKAGPSAPMQHCRLPATWTARIGQYLQLPFSC
ncbi:hypothetical protein WJX73_009249 [Symbiochloris irregularis]|uniref:Uncharacterized protein n=1 Tax=Symbiochloris irregularis TaxID=706552 RepID=A0AAW1P1A1_9CHLO